MVQLLLHSARGAWRRALASSAWATLFPTRQAFAIFCGYIALFIGQGVLVTASQTGGAGSGGGGAGGDNGGHESPQSPHYAYNTSVVVLLTEVLKLAMSVGLYLRT